jgi:hypothetical protein
VIYARPYDTQIAQQWDADAYRITQKLETNFAVSNKTTSGCGEDLFRRDQPSGMFLM